MTAVNEGARGDKRKANAERNQPAAVCTVCGNHAPVEAVVAAARAALVEVHARYFDMDGKPGFDDTTPEPEDVWRYDRDFRAALGDPR